MVLALLQLPCGQFGHHLLEGVAKLADQAHRAVVKQGQNSHPAGVLHHFPEATRPLGSSALSSRTVMIFPSKSTRLSTVFSISSIRHIPFFAQPLHCGIQIKPHYIIDSAPFANPPNHYSYPKSTAIRYNTINGRIDFCKRRPVMTIQPIGSASVALYITPADLKEHGLTPAGLTLERALAITQTAFHEAGITLEGSIEIEAYPDACGVLVFAHVRARRSGPGFLLTSWSLWWPRPGICPHRGRMRRCSGGRTAGGSRWERGRSRPLRGCRSSAAVRPHAPHLEARLAEHGRPVWDQDALTALLSYFPV